MKWLNAKFLTKTLIIIILFTNEYLLDINNKTLHNKQKIKKWNDKRSNLKYINDNIKDITCAHEAGHTIIILNSKFKNDFQKMEFFPINMQYAGKTEYQLDLDYINQTNKISNSDLYTLLQIDLGGLAGEAIFSNTDPFQYMINQAWAMNSSDLYNYHNTYQAEFEARNLKSSNESSLFFIKKQFNETKKIINNNKLVWNKIIETCILINYVNKEHIDYILKHKEIPMPLFTKEKIVTFNKTQIEKFSYNQIQKIVPKQITYFSKKQISYFTTSQITYFTTRQIFYFTEAQIQAFWSWQISELTLNQIRALQEAQIQAFRSWQISTLTAAQIQALTVEQISSLTAKQINNLTPQQIKNLTATQIQALTTAQISELTTAQIQAFWLWQISELTLNQIRTLQTEQIQAILPIQILALTPKQIQVLTEKKYHH